MSLLDILVATFILLISFFALAKTEAVSFRSEQTAGASLAAAEQYSDLFAYLQVTQELAGTFRNAIEYQCSSTSPESSLSYQYLQCLIRQGDSIQQVTLWKEID
ncbi:hypothetical protein JNK13_06200 [bacterium]|nr:hypothetical protein [bacterium]